MMLAASPRRGRMLAAKALVVGAVMGVAGLVAALLALWVGARSVDSVLPVPTGTEVRTVVGTALLFAVTGVLALAAGTALRRGTAAVAVVVTALVLPYALATSSILPTGASQWLLRVTPAAGFAVQQSLDRFDHVDGAYSPADGYFPLAPWTGFAVLCAYTLAALATAHLLLRRRDV